MQLTPKKLRQMSNRDYAVEIVVRHDGATLKRYFSSHDRLCDRDYTEILHLADPDRLIEHVRSTEFHNVKIVDRRDEDPDADPWAGIGITL